MRKRLFFIFVFTILMVSCIFSIDEKGIALLNKAKGMIDYGIEIGEESLLKDAIRTLNEFVILYPKDKREVREAYIMIGDAYYALMQYSNAVEYYKKAIEVYSVKDSRYNYTMYSLAFAYYKMGKYERAIEYFKSLYETSYKDEAMVNVGAILIEIGDYRKAIIELSKVASKDWKPNAFYYLGIAYEKTGLVNEAIEKFEKAAEMTDNDELIVSSLYKATEILLSTGRINEAYNTSKKLFDKYGSGKSEKSFEITLLYSEILYRLRFYTQGLKILQDELKNTFENDKRAKLLRAIGWFYYKLGKTDETEKSWNEALNIGSKDEKYIVGINLAELYREVGKKEKAIEIYEYLKSVYPDKSVELSFKKIKVLIDMENYDKALSELNSLKALYPFESLYWISQVYRAKGELDKAIHEAEKLLTLAKNDAEKVDAYFLLGDINYQMGDDKKAREYYERILNIGNEKERIKAYLNLGMIYYTLGDYIKASEYFKKVQQNAKLDINLAVDAVYYLAESMLALGRYDEAQKYYKWLEENDVSGRYTENALIKSIWVLINSGRYDEALENVDEYIKRYEGKVRKELIYLKGEILLKMGRTTQAYNVIKDLVISTLSDQSAAGVLYIKAKYFESKGELSRASEFFEKIVKDYPQTSKAPWAAMDNAMIFYKSGKYERAKKMFFNIVTGYPDFEKIDTAFYYIGRCYEALGEKEKAVRVYEELLKKFPESSKKSDAIERLEKLKR